MANRAAIELALHRFHKRGGFTPEDIAELMTEGGVMVLDPGGTAHYPEDVADVPLVAEIWPGETDTRWVSGWSEVPLFEFDMSPTGEIQEAQS